MLHTTQNPTALLLTVLAIISAGCESAGPIDPGPRAAQLAAQLPDSPLRAALQRCDESDMARSTFVIAHRGAPLGYPEHTREGYVAAANMGAGLIECDVTFTADGTLVCRHSQCDLHRTTNILQTDLASQCSESFTPADGAKKASARCCTSDITLAQYRTLCGRRDIVDDSARTIEAYLAEPPSPVVEDPETCGTLLTHRESIELIDQLGADFVPELKAPMVEMPFGSNQLTQQKLASAMLEEYEALGIDPVRVFPQSFNPADIAYWQTHHAEYAPRLVWLDARSRDPGFKATLKDMQRFYDDGLRYIAPPIPALVTLGPDGRLQPSDYARLARAAGLNIITWTFESGRASDPDNWLYAHLDGYVDREGKMLEVLDMLAREVGVTGVFSDWPGTVSYYAGCTGIK